MFIDVKSIKSTKNGRTSSPRIGLTRETINDKMGVLHFVPNNKGPMKVKKEKREGVVFRVQKGKE